jgi:hypothetical protein
MGRTGTSARSPADAVRMYQRMLAAWASDVLALRRAGLDTPGLRSGNGSSWSRPAKGARPAESACLPALGA